MQTQPFCEKVFATLSIFFSPGNNRQHLPAAPLLQVVEDPHSQMVLYMEVLPKTPSRNVSIHQLCVHVAVSSPWLETTRRASQESGSEAAFSRPMKANNWLKTQLCGHSSTLLAIIRG